MSESRSGDYREIRQAEEELGGHGERVVEPVEETPEMAAAVEDDTALTGPEVREAGQGEDRPADDEQGEDRTVR